MPRYTSGVFSTRRFLSPAVGETRRRPILGAASDRLFRLAQLAGWGTYGLSLFLTFLPSIPPSEAPLYLLAKLGRAGLGLLASLGLLRVYRGLRARGATLPAVLFAALASCAVLGALWMIAYDQVITKPLLGHREAFDWAGLPRGTIDYGFVLLTWSAIYFGVVHWQTSVEQSRRAREAELRLREAQLHAREAQFHMVSSQVNPHFLFNALNSVRELISEDGSRAEAMVTQLADLLRYTLVTEPFTQITLDEESGIVRSYLAIQGIRFEGRLDAAVVIRDPAGRCRIPRFLLLPLVENAVKHGTRDRDGRVHLRVEAQVCDSRLSLKVTNSGSLGRHEAIPGKPGVGLGWTSITNRLEHLYPGAHRFEVTEQGGNVVAIVELPASEPEEA